ncbi:MAG: hypothetical protein AABX02_03925, partial [archaeon]
PAADRVIATESIASAPLPIDSVLSDGSPILVESDRDLYQRRVRNLSPDEFYFPFHSSSESIGWVSLPLGVQLDQPLEGYAANDLPQVIATLSKNGGVPSDFPLAATLTFPDGTVHELGEENIQKVETGEFDVHAFRPRNFKPGLYTITVKTGNAANTLDSSSSDSTAYFQGGPSPNEASRSFYWGLVAVNTRQSIYQPGETAEFEMVVLDKDSLGVKNAKVVLSVVSPDGASVTLGTGSDSVQETTSPGVYLARLPVVAEGVYHVEVHALAPGINSIIRTTFDVRSHYDFDIVRGTNTKIDPAHQPLEVDLAISTVDSTAKIITIREAIPLDLNVTTDSYQYETDENGNVIQITIPNPYVSVYETHDEKIIEWKNVPLNDAGEAVLHYQYTVPDVKPWLYLLGPIEIISDENNPTPHSIFPAPGRRRGSDSFWEARSWMIAVDANPTSKLFFRQRIIPSDPKPNDSNCSQDCDIDSYLAGVQSIIGMSDINGVTSDQNAGATNTTVGIKEFFSSVSYPLIPQTITTSGTWMAGIRCDISNTSDNNSAPAFTIYRWIAATDSNGERIVKRFNTSSSCLTTDTFLAGSRAGNTSSVTFERGDKIIVEVLAAVNSTAPPPTTRTLTYSYGNSTSLNDGNVILPSGVTLQFAGDANTQIVSPTTTTTRELMTEFQIDANGFCHKDVNLTNSGFSCGDVNVNLMYCPVVGGVCVGPFVDMNTVVTSPLFISSGTALQSDDVLAPQDQNTFVFQVKGAIGGLYTIRSKIDSNWMVDMSFSNETNSDINVIIDSNASCDLNNIACFTSLWNGGTSNDYLGYSEYSGTTTLLVNVDGNAYANDLLFVAPYADVNAKIDSGAVYLVKDIDTKTGSHDFNILTNFDVRWSGSRASDNLGRNNLISTNELDEPTAPSVQLVNVDGNAFANDLLISASFADSGGRLNAGAVYLIKDVNTLSGVKDMNVMTSFNVAVYGSAASDGLGASFSSGQTVVLGNLDGNSVPNDLLFSVPNTDFTFATQGSLYLLKDVNTLSGIVDFNSTSQFNARWDGENASASLGWSSDSGNGVEIVNIDDNAVANDVLVISTGAGALFNGKVYLIKDINSASGILPLTTSTNYSVAWVGGSILDGLGTTALAGDGVQLVNADGNAYANDLIISATSADAGAADNGAVYLVMDVDKKSGSNDMATASNYRVRFAGGAASDKIGDSLTSGQGVQWVNVDGNAYANDLLITATNADVGATDSGAVYLIKDVNTLSGNLALSSSTSYNVRWNLATAGDVLGGTQGSGLGVQLVNLDNNVVSNDLLLTAFGANIVSGDNGVVYLISDINTLSGNKDLPTTTNFNLRIYGEGSMFLGSSNFSGPGTQLVNVDGNQFANDLLLTASISDAGGSDRGAVYLVRDINRYFGTGNDLSLGSSTNYAVRWFGGTTGDFLGDTNASGSGIQLVNLDKNLYSNDLLLSAPFADVNGKVDSGAVYLVRDIDKRSGDFDLNNTTSYTKMWSGGITADYLGMAPGGGAGLQIINSDGNSFNNDLLFTSYYADVNAKINNGAVHLVRNVVDANAAVFSVKVVSPSDANILIGTQRIDLNLLGVAQLATDYNFDINYSVS